jgi:hypothetical protein
MPAEPLLGDRAAWDALGYQDVHTNDINLGGVHWTAQGVQDIGGLGPGTPGLTDAATDPIFHADGALIVTADINGVWICPRDSTILAVYAHCRTPGSAGSTVVDVHLNGVTIFTTQASRPELDWDDADQVAKSATPDITALVEYDVLTVDVDQIATGAKDLTVMVAMNVVSNLGLVTHRKGDIGDWGVNFGTTDFDVSNVPQTIQVGCSEILFDQDNWIAFPIPFTLAPIVVCTPGGGVPSAIMMMHHDVSTTGFYLKAYKDDGALTTVFYGNWIAIGPI